MENAHISQHNASDTEAKPGRRRFLLRLSWAGLIPSMAAFSAAVLRFFFAAGVQPARDERSSGIFAFKR